MAEDRDRFRRHDGKTRASPCRNPAWRSTWTRPWRSPTASAIPMMVRPSYVLGGRGMEVVYDDAMLRDYMAAAIDVTPERPILMDRFLQHAMECETDAISDGNQRLCAHRDGAHRAGRHPLRRLRLRDALA